MSIWTRSLGKSLIRKNNQITHPETWYFESLVLPNTYLFFWFMQNISRVSLSVNKARPLKQSLGIQTGTKWSFPKTMHKDNFLIYFPSQCSLFIIALYIKQRHVYYFLFTIEMTVWTIIIFFVGATKACLWVWS